MTRERETRPPEPRVAGRCVRCGGEIYEGEAAYRLAGGWLCPECLPDAARCCLAGLLEVAGERGGEE